MCNVNRMSYHASITTTMFDLYLIPNIHFLLRSLVTIIKFGFPSAQNLQLCELVLNINWYENRVFLSFVFNSAPSLKINS